MYNPAAPILEVGKSYLVGESQRGLLITNEISILPVLVTMNLADLTQTVLVRGRSFTELGDFLNKLHAGQIHVGEVLVTKGNTRIELPPALAASYQAPTCSTFITMVMMAAAKGFSVTVLGGHTESFDTDKRRFLPEIMHYQLCWVDHNGYHIPFVDIEEVM